MRSFLLILLSEAIGIMFLSNNLYGGGDVFSDVDRLMEDTKKVFQKVDNSYNIIENSATGKSVYTVLKNYQKRDEAKLVSSWFRMATQLTSNRKMAFLINNSSYKVKALTSKLVLDEKNPLSSKDRAFIFEKIDYLVDRTAIDKPQKLEEIYEAKKDVFVRSMPIVNKLTKKRVSNKFLVLKKGEAFKVLYKLHYKNRNDYLLYWGFVETFPAHQQGWVNLNKLNIK